MNHLGEHAIVIGGSMAGLMAARVLAGRFERVTVIERDTIAAGPASRRSVPQGAHIHALLLGGERVLSSLYPGFSERLRDAGAQPLRAGRDIAYFLPGGKAYSPGGAMKEPRDLGFDLYGASRGLIEHCVREATRVLANVVLETDVVQGLLCVGGRILGVRCESGQGRRELLADLVVDAGGRGSRAVRWLEALGFAPPPETVIGVDMAYASTCFHVRAGGEPERQLVFRGPAPHHRRSAIMGRIEKDLWHVTLSGRGGEVPPFDHAGFMAYARSLHSNALHQLINGAVRVGDIVPYQFPTSVRWHFERLEALPEGWLALGDAICSFNPIYGQGMSVAALHCQALQRLLEDRAQQPSNLALTGLGRQFFNAAAQVCEQPWTLAANQDFAFAQTRGIRPAGLAERALYAAALDSLIPEEPQLHRLLAEVVNLARPLSALGEEPWRSLAMERLERQQKSLAGG